MSGARKQTGKDGENTAVEYLKKKGYTILHTNYFTRYGEIDIIAEIGTTLVFCEVKTRRSTHFGKPHDNITRRKIRHLMSAVQEFLLKHSYKSHKYSLDVLSVMMLPQASPTIRHFQNITKDL